MTFGRRGRQLRNTNAVKLCREKIRRAKAQLELNLAIAVKDNNNVSVNILATKGGLRDSRSFIGCGGKHIDKG